MFGENLEPILWRNAKLFGGNLKTYVYPPIDQNRVLCRLRLEEDLIYVDIYIRLFRYLEHLLNFASVVFSCRECPWIQPLEQLCLRLLINSALDRDIRKCHRLRWYQLRFTGPHPICAELSEISLMCVAENVVNQISVWQLHCLSYGTPRIK